MSNHCEVLVSLPDNMATGFHTIMVAGGSQIEIEILETGSLGDPGQGGKIAGTPLPTSVKGYELYSWRAGDGWHFTLTTGTNRNKNYDELISLENVITESGWVKITVHGVDALHTVLDSVPASEQILWLDGKQIESSDGSDLIRFPPEALIQQIIQYSRQQGINLLIDQ